MPQTDQPNPLAAADGLPARLSGEWIRRKHHYLCRYCGITATGMKNAFPRRVFVEADPSLAAALEKRVGAHPKARQTTVICEDWAKVAAAGRLRFDGLVVAFVDPTGISQVPWMAMERFLRDNPKIDLLTTLQYAMGITLNAYQPVKKGG
jgi:hypothetical protein